MAEIIPFSNTRIKELPAPSGKNPDKYKDRENPKLYLFVYPPSTTSKTTSKIFRLISHVPSSGKTRDIKIGSWTPQPGDGGYTVEMARKKAGELLGMIRDGKDPVSEKKAEKEKLAGIPTLRELRDDYLRRKGTKVSVDTAKQRYIYDFDKYGSSLLDMKVTEITFHVLDAHIAKLMAEKPREGVMEIWLRAWSAIFNLEKEIYPDFVDPSVIKKVRKALGISKAPPRTRTLQDHEIPIFYDYVFKHSCLSGNSIETSTSADFFYFLLFTGCRKSEATPLKWEDVHLNQNPPYLFLRKIKKTRSGDKFRQIPITEPIRNLLELRKPMKDHSPYVFPGTGSSGYLSQPKNFINRFRDTHKELFKLDEDSGKADRFSIHDFRRTWLTLGVQKCPIIPIKKLVGHSVSGKDVTEKVYYQPSIEQLYETAETVVKLILEKCEGRKNVSDGGH